jgi:hypothetical protein
MRDHAAALEKRLGWAAIDNLGLFLAAMNAAVWGLSLLKPEFPSRLVLDASALRSGELWRALTFLFVPPPLSPLFMLLWLYLLFIFARALEHAWGAFRFNLYYGLGAASLLAAALLGGVSPDNQLLNASVFLAFAALHPDSEMLLFFILPVKARWLAAAAWGILFWTLITASRPARLAALAGVANYAVFFGPGHLRALRDLWRSWNWRRKLK